MPMIDYLCGECHERVEHFYHSEAPDAVPCENTHCPTGTSRRIYSLPGEHRPVNASRFTPIVVWVNNENPDVVSMPGRADEPVQPGYHAVEITDMRMADRYTQHMNNVSLRDAINQRAMEKEYWDAVTKDRRDSIRARIGSNMRMNALFESVCKVVDAKRERRYSKTLDPRGHFQALSYDSSNRQGHCDSDTNWKTRRS